MDHSENSQLPFLPRFNRLIGILGCFAGLLLMPAIFAPLFSMGPMMKVEVNSLWVVSPIIIFVSACFIWRREKIPAGRSLFYFSLILLFLLEIIIRSCINVFATEQKKRLLGDQSGF